jgi:hypothetical protein
MKEMFGVNLWDTFAPVVTWMSIRLMLILVILLAWHARQVNFVLAFLQAPVVECLIYMKIPVDVDLNGRNPITFMGRKREEFGMSFFTRG